MVYTHTHTHIYVCVCVCVRARRKRKRGGEREIVCVNQTVFRDFLISNSKYGLEIILHYIVHQWSRGPGFNSRLCHTKNSKHDT